MRKCQLMLLLLSMALLFSSCTTVALPLTDAAATLVPDTNPVLPEAQAPQELDIRESATLYFRYLDEPYLAPETRAITSSPSKPYELSLLTELLSGPGTRSTDLRALFPAGTQVISTVTNGRTLFVTLSAEIMDAYADEPEDWMNDPSLQKEVPLRRELCMQSLVATITENCDVDQVQILVQQPGQPTESLRLKTSYYMLGTDSNSLAAPLTRREDLLLTPHNTFKIILQLWNQRDWQRLYNYIALKDPFTGVERVSYRDFVTAMENQPMLVDFSFSGGSVTLDGNQATYTLAATLRTHSGQALQAEGRILRLWRESGLWRMTLSQLTGWLEE